MKKKLIIFLGITILIAFLYCRYIGGLMFWLFMSPVDGELKSEEKILFKEIETELRIDVSRYPSQYISDPKDTLSYELYLSGNCDSYKDSIEVKAKNIALKINNRLNLNPKFYKYKITFSCAYIGKKEYSFLRNELSK